MAPYNPNVPNPEDLLVECDSCSGDGFRWTQPGLLGTPFTEVICRDCDGTGLATKDAVKRRKKDREPDHDPDEDRLPDPSREP